LPAHEVLVSIPSRQCSGTGHGFTFTRAFGVQETEFSGAPCLLVDALPSDAVKYALVHHYTTPPDLVLAGINPGENAGVCSPYSGTVACAREAALWGVPALALSSCGMNKDHYHAIAAWTVQVLAQGLPPFLPHTFWNINFPAHAPSAWGAPRICRSSNTMFVDHYRLQDDGLVHLEGHKPHESLLPDTDDWWLAQGHPALVPHRCDPTEPDLLTTSWVAPAFVPQERP
jgi:5'-nucleotidase